MFQEPIEVRTMSSEPQKKC